MMAPRRAVAFALGLALLQAAGCTATPPPAPRPTAAIPPGTDWAQAPVVEVALEEYAFRPERLALRQGQPVRLRFVNRGGRAHDFTAPDFFAAAATRAGDPVTAGGSVEVPAGQAREVAVVPLRAGRFAVDCEKPLHAMFGMTGEIVVAPPA